jgi:hypothetical protein
MCGYAVLFSDVLTHGAAVAAESSIYFSIPRSIITARSPPVFSKMNARPFCRISFAKNEDGLATRLHP